MINVVTTIIISAAVLEITVYLVVTEGVVGVMENNKTSIYIAGRKVDKHREIMVPRSGVGVVGW